MDEPQTQSASWSLAVLLSTVGGFLGAAGALLPWFQATGVRPSEIFGNEIVATRSLAGTSDLFGLAALILGVLIGVLGVGALLFTGEGVRRNVGTLAIVGGLLLLGAAGLGLVRASSVAAEADLGGTAERIEHGVMFGLFVSAGGGAVAAAGGLVARRLGP